MESEMVFDIDQVRSWVFGPGKAQNKKKDKFLTWFISNPGIGSTTGHAPKWYVWE